MPQNLAAFVPTAFLERSIELDRRADGVILLRNAVPLQPLHAHIPGLLHLQAARHPQRTWLAQRDPETDEWRRLSYAQGLARVNAVTQSLLELGQAGRVVLVLSGNSIEHAVLQMAAMQAGMPYAPITPAYSQLSRDHVRLKSMVEVLDPAVVFVQSGQAFAAALRALDLSGAHVVHVDDPVSDIPSSAWSRWVSVTEHPDVAAALGRLNHDTLAKILFTSGSTGMPKAVPITQGMMCAALAMASQMLDTRAETFEKVLLEWLPWSHVAGGTAIFNSVLNEGLSLYLDGGRPMPGQFSQTLRNLREISPFRLGNMPLGYAMLLEALDSDEELGRSLFRHLRRLASMGARLPDSVYEGIQSHAVRHTGYRIPFTAAYGSTETTAAVSCVYWPTERADLVGLPHPGVEMKLVPLDDGRYDVRVRSPTVLAGYLHRPELSAQAFDEEGFFRMGDAVSFVDEADPVQGLAFAGRTAEEFKLQSGVFVRVGSLRVDLISALAPLVVDAVLTGADQAEVGAMVWLNLAACRQRFGQPEASMDQLVALPALRNALRDGVDAHNRRHPGSSTCIRRLEVLQDPPSMDAGEVNDKGYIQQRLVLERRRDWVLRLHAEPTPAGVMRFD